MYREHDNLGKQQRRRGLQTRCRSRVRYRLGQLEWHRQQQYLPETAKVYFRPCYNYGIHDCVLAWGQYSS
jgi:hypothetical protein